MKTDTLIIESDSRSYRNQKSNFLPRMKVIAIVVSYITVMMIPHGTIAQTCGGAGTITTDGSTTVEPVTKELSIEYNNKCPDTRFTLASGGSTAGAMRVCAVPSAGSAVDIGNMSRLWRSTEATLVSGSTYKCKEGGDAGREVIQVPVALDGVSIIIEKDGKSQYECISKLPQQSLSTVQLRWIFSNLTTLDNTIAASDGNPFTHLWSELHPDCPAEEFYLVAPSSSYGTHVFFDEVIFKSSVEGFRTPIEYQNDNSVELYNSVVNNDYSIGFLGYSFYFLNDATLFAPAVNGVFPNATSLTDDSYVPLSRSIYSNFWKDTSSLAKTKCFADFHFSKIGAAYITAKNLLPTKAGKWKFLRSTIPGTCKSPCSRCGFFRRLFGLCRNC
jgi:ABC-type phosphate transport system substrate-binding protein